jgi:hypothetical protein
VCHLSPGERESEERDREAADVRGLIFEERKKNGYISLISQGFEKHLGERDAMQLLAVVTREK